MGLAHTCAKFFSLTNAGKRPRISFSRVEQSRLSCRIPVCVARARVCVRLLVCMQYCHITSAGHRAARPRYLPHSATCRVPRPPCPRSCVDRTSVQPATPPPGAVHCSPNTNRSASISALQSLLSRIGL